jgi:hypothetical protein
MVGARWGRREALSGLPGGDGGHRHDCGALPTGVYVIVPE